MHPIILFLMGCRLPLQCHGIVSGSGARLKTAGWERASIYGDLASYRTRGGSHHHTGRAADAPFFANEYEIVGEASNGLEAISMVEEFKPDIVLMDISMPKMNGLEAIREIKATNQQVKILVLHRAQDGRERSGGIRGGSQRLRAQVRGQGRTALGHQERVRRRIVHQPDDQRAGYRRLIAGSRALKETTSWDTLTARERQVLKLIAEGHTNREIADFLHQRQDHGNPSLQHHEEARPSQCLGVDRLRHEERARRRLTPPRRGSFVCYASGGRCRGRRLRRPGREWTNRSLPAAVFERLPRVSPRFFGFPQR